MSGIAAAGLNTVRIPVPFWIVEDIVDRSREPYAQGGLDELVCLVLFMIEYAMPNTYAQIRGLYMFKDAGYIASFRLSPARTYSCHLQIERHFRPPRLAGCLFMFVHLLLPVTIIGPTDRPPCSSSWPDVRRELYYPS